MWYHVGDAESWRLSYGTVADRVLEYGVESGCGRMQPLSPYIGRAVELYAQFQRNKYAEYCGEGVCEGFE